MTANGQPGPGQQPADPGEQRQSRSPPARRRREIRSASRCTLALPVCACSTSRAMCASWVSAPTRVARTTSRPLALRVAPTHGVARTDVDRHRLAGDHRRVHRRDALRRPRRRWRSSRPDAPRTRRPTLEEVDRAPGSRRPSRSSGRLGGAQLQQRPDGLARLLLRARLELASEQQEGDDRHDGLEVDAALARATRQA